MKLADEQNPFIIKAMYDLTAFSLKDMTNCGAALRQLGTDASSMEEVGNRIMRYFFDHLVDEAGQRTTVLARLFITHPYNQLEPVLRQRIDNIVGHPPEDETMKCFTLLSTAGIEPAWNQRQNSTNYKVYPLTAQMIDQFPMFSQVYKEFGVDVDMILEADPVLLVHLEQKTYNVFYVPDAVDSPYIPDQTNFVLPYKVRSVLGFFGILPSGNHFTAILFSKAIVSRETTDYFKTLALSVKMALLPFDETAVFAQPSTNAIAPENQPPKDAAHVRSEATGYKQLLGVHEQVVQTQWERLEQVVAELEQKIAENARLRQKAAETAVTEERHRLARDLHDSVTQALYSQTLYAEAAVRQLEANNADRAADHLRQLRQTAQQALREMRLLIFELRPSALEAAGLAAALRARLEAVEERTGIATAVSVPNDLQLTLETETGLYWIAQEALNNALKHAQADKIEIKLTQEAGRVVLCITDNGVGMETAVSASHSTKVSATKGTFGLRSMQERATGLGWQLTINSAPGQGTAIQVEVFP